MSTRIILIIIVVIILVVGAFALQRNDAGEPIASNESGDATTEEKENDGATMEEKSEESTMEEKRSSVTIVYTDNGYNPATVTIDAGTTVIFANESSGINWPASAFHPTHTVYPNSSITKCGTSEANQIFDACTSLQSGETYSFTFNEVGEWGYHNHVRASHFGKIIVQ